MLLLGLCGTEAQQTGISDRRQLELIEELLCHTVLVCTDLSECVAIFGLEFNRRRDFSREPEI